MTAPDVMLARLLAESYGLPPGVTVEAVALRLAAVPAGPDEGIARSDEAVLADAASRMTGLLLDEAWDLMRSGRDDAARRRLTDARSYQVAARRTYRRLRRTES